MKVFIRSIDWRKVEARNKTFTFKGDTYIVDDPENLGLLNIRFGNWSEFFGYRLAYRYVAERFTSILPFGETSSDTTCTICLERELTLVETVGNKRRSITQLPVDLECKHAFHKACILENIWHELTKVYQTKKMPPKCPLCRKIIEIPYSMQPRGILDISYCRLIYPIVRVKFEPTDANIHPFGINNGSFSRFAVKSRYILFYPRVPGIQYILGGIIKLFKNNDLLVFTGSDPTLRSILPLRRLCDCKECLHHKHLFSRMSQYIDETLNVLRRFRVTSGDVETENALLDEVKKWKKENKYIKFPDYH